jgi:DNA modification methylase
MIIVSDALEALKRLPDGVADCGVTSPPYYGLRDYGVAGQIGLEATPQEYVDRLVAVFREFWRVLRDDGTLWINIADSYAGGGRGGGSPKQMSNRGTVDMPRSKVPNGIKPKDLIGIPWMLAFALRADGWYLRQEIIWAKPNPMPESVTDRCTKSHESIFLLSKQPKYYFNAAAIAEPVADTTIRRLGQDVENQAGSTRVPGKTNGPMKAAAPRYGGKKYAECPDVFMRTKSGNAYDFRENRNKRDVWTVTTKPFSGAHFATFPKDLIEPCILAGSRKGGLVVDMFCGSGTTGIVALSHERQFLGIEISPEYAKIAEARIIAETDWRTKLFDVEGL